MNPMNIDPLGQPTAAARSTQAAPAQAPPDARAQAGPSFHALLEKLETQAAGLARHEPTSPDALSGAVSDARSSLDAALTLGRDLVEAYREAHLGNHPPARQAG